VKKALLFLAIIAALLGVWFFFRKNNTAAGGGNGAGSGAPALEIATPGTDAVSKTFKEIQAGRLNTSIQSATAIVQSPSVANNIVITHANNNAFV
jgi:hypothetical protein